MQSGRAYKSFIGRIANKQRMSKYNAPKEDVKSKGLLAKRDNADATEDKDVDDVLAEYISVVKKVIGVKDEQ